MQENAVIITGLMAVSFFWVHTEGGMYLLVKERLNSTTKFSILQMYTYFVRSSWFDRTGAMDHRACTVLDDPSVRVGISLNWLSGQSGLVCWSCAKAEVLSGVV